MRFTHDFSPADIKVVLNTQRIYNFSYPFTRFYSVNYLNNLISSGLINFTRAIPIPIKYRGYEQPKFAMFMEDIVAMPIDNSYNAVSFSSMVLDRIDNQSEAIVGAEDFTKAVSISSRKTNKDDTISFSSYLLHAGAFSPAEPRASAQNYYFHKDVNALYKRYSWARIDDYEKIRIKIYCSYAKSWVWLKPKNLLY